MPHTPTPRIESETTPPVASRRPRASIVMNDARMDRVYAPQVRARLAACFELQPFNVDRHAIEVLFTGWGGPVLDGPMLETLPALAACFHAAGTVRPMTTDVFWRRNITLCSAYHANAEPVAHFCQALIVLLLKSAFPAQRRHGRPPHGIRDATIGLVSYGTVARLLRTKLAELDATVLVYDPYLTAAEAAAHGVRKVTLAELFATATVVSLHTPLLPETRHLIGAAELRALRPGAALINTARGGIVDHAALTALLVDRPDVFACLDVTDPEPLPAESPLPGLPNVFFTPHIAGSLGTECDRLGEAMAGEAERYLKGVPLKWRIDAEMVKRMA